MLRYNIKYSSGYDIPMYNVYDYTTGACVYSTHSYINALKMQNKLNGVY